MADGDVANGDMADGDVAEVFSLLTGHVAMTTH